MLDLVELLILLPVGNMDIKMDSLDKLQFLDNLREKLLLKAIMASYTDTCIRNYGDLTVDNIDPVKARILMYNSEGEDSDE